MCRDENLFKELSKVEAKHMLFGDALKVAVKRSRYNLVPIEEWPNWRNQRRVLCIQSQKQHI